MANLPFCLCGVRGGHLATRIEEIVANRRRSELTRARQAALVLAAIEDRFKLRWHRETREGPVYVLSVARGGHKLRASGDCAAKIDPDKPLPAPAPGRTQRLCGNNWLNGRGPRLFDIDVELPRFQPLAGADLAPPDTDAFTVIREQLGLVLEQGRGPLDYFVIDSIGRPSEN